jgi:hypothetical protein
MTREEVVKKYPIGSKFKVLKSGLIKEVGAYGNGSLGVLIKEHDSDFVGFNPHEIEPVVGSPKHNGLRMYFFVMYNLSGIQKGIQAGHAAVEYSLTYGHIEQYKMFAAYHKTFILLDGGGSNDMIQRKTELWEFGINHTGFYEPDLNNSLSAIAFIVPETIYGAKDGDFNESSYQEKLRQYLKGFRLASN